MRRLLLLAFLFMTLFLALPASAATTASISLTTATTKVNADQSVTFAVTAKTSDGQTIDVTAQSVFSTDDPMGGMNAAVYHPGKVGTWTVQAVHQGFTARVKMTVTPGAIAELEINPNSDPEILNIGETRIFTVTAFDRRNNIVAKPDVAWAVTGDLGTMSAAGKFTATQTGLGKIQATVGSVTSAIDLRVGPAEKPVTPANTNATAATTQSNTNAAKPATNTNVAAANTNVNASTNAAANINAAGNANAATPKVAGAASKKCTTASPWVWVGILVTWLILLVVLFAFLPVKRIWPAVVALIGGAGLVIAHYGTGCHQLAWWPWTAGLGTVLVTLLAFQQSPER